MLTLTLECPTHPKYDGKIRPAVVCGYCKLLFSVRNETHKVLSTPRPERSEAAERLIKEIA